MIDITNISQTAPYKIFKAKYKEATNAGQKNIEAFCISSYNSAKHEVDSRFVNLKFISNDEFIFFSNYNSPKATAFISHNQIGALIFWSSINVQIRMKAKIKKTAHEYNQKYFYNRAKEKNALAISSKQSEIVESYEDVIKNYSEAYKKNDLSKCPKYWGGFSFIPYYFEFWEGHNSRINKREVFEKSNQGWNQSIIEP